MRKIDYLGAVLVALGLAGPVFALIEQPVYGMGDPVVWVPFARRARAAGRVRAGTRRRSTTRCCRCGCSARATSRSATSTTLLVYGGLGAATFFVTIFLQQVAGYSAVAAGLTLLPLTAIMFTALAALGRALGPHRAAAADGRRAARRRARADLDGPASTRTSNYLTRPAAGGARVRRSGCR